jgi:hypothetical protein
MVAARICLKNEKYIIFLSGFPWVFMLGIQNCSVMGFKHSFETRPRPAGRPGARTGPGWRKNRVGKNPVRPGCNPLTLVFFTKTTSFWFKKIDPTDPVTRSKPGTRALDRDGSENYGFKVLKMTCHLEPNYHLDFFFLLDLIIIYFTL